MQLLLGQAPSPIYIDDGLFCFMLGEETYTTNITARDAKRKVCDRHLSFISPCKKYGAFCELIGYTCDGKKMTSGCVIIIVNLITNELCGGLWQTGIELAWTTGRERSMKIGEVMLQVEQVIP